VKTHPKLPTGWWLWIASANEMRLGTDGLRIPRKAAGQPASVTIFVGALTGTGTPAAGR